MNKVVDWSIDEARTWIQMYLEGYTKKDEKVLFNEIAAQLNRPVSSVKLRFAEIRRILGGHYDFPVVTPNFVTAVNEVIDRGEYTEKKLKIIFE